MVAQYTIAGRQVGSHVVRRLLPLAMITLGSMAGISFLATGGEKKSKEQGPPINATSKDEENFIQEFIKNAEASGTAKH
ncbi:hypothetical protein L228DRAFT_244328 [Xylona heveae TC161]|uniref:Uncharacterized protein n=1 Tax=Xylona heveae (strain CBS 132557 / TC161) TaxID=1328760 RepID=A0A165IWQ9_XYLHT|nr:hypothetical protein L228DRAFT_244328 [Xylona heveae TC161]KZF25481.1 hypothetical protein L228DRAFT_244328 [Xylona heveae TC161]